MDCPLILHISSMIQPDPTALRLAQQWQLNALETLAMTTTARLWRSEDKVLKVFTETGRRDEATGTHWLRWAAGNGAVELIDSCDEAQLLRYCDGPNLLEFPDQAAIHVFCDLVAAFPTSSPPAGLVPLRERWAALFRATSTVNHSCVDAAQRIGQRLLETTTSRVALHGDLHHENILRDGSTWRAIDPKGVLGDPCYDLANMFLNPIARPELVQANGRVTGLRDVMAKRLSLDPNRIISFAFVHSVVASLWCLEDGQDPAAGWSMAELLFPLAKEVENALFP